MAAEIHDILHFSTCLPRNDLCTAEPQTIIYSSPHRPAVHDAKVKALLRDDPSKPAPAIQTTFPPSKRSLAPLTESKAEIQPANPQPNRPPSSSSQTNSDDERLTRTSYNVYLHAPRPLIQRGRGDILQHLKLHHQTFISASHNLLLNEQNVLPPAYADEFDKIAVESCVEIIIALPSNQNFTIFSNRKKNLLRRGYLDNSEELKEGTEDVIIVLNGSLPSLESGMIKLRVLLDRMEGQVCEVLEGIKHHTHPLLAGRRRFEVEENIEKEYKVKIYMHAPTVKVFKDDPHIDRHHDRIYITGAQGDVQKAVAALQARTATFMTMSKDVVLHGSKIDWIITEKLEKLREIMDEDSTFIKLPHLGSDSTVVTVSGTTLPLIERSIRRMNKLISDYFQFTYVILPDTNTSLDPPYKLSALAWYTGAEVNYSGNCFEINGNDNAIRILLDLLIKGEVTFYKQYPYRVRIRCEMANELQEFVAGKKSGKVNKIMKQSNCNISFETYTEYNFLIDIMAPQLDEILEGYKALLEEFPAELYWYVPEEYHKRIIGVQGKTIQRIMKHYSVYVKFFNALEFAAAGGDAKTEDNVLARTPAKNHSALDDCKKAVLEMVFQNDKDYITETIEIPKIYHSFLQSKCQSQLQDIGKNSGATIRFPEPNTSLEAVAITAAPTRIRDVARGLLNLVPMTFSLVGDDPKLSAIVESSDFDYAIKDQIKVVYHIELTIKENVSNAAKTPRSFTFQFQYYRTNYEMLKKAIGELCRYVATKGATLEPAMPGEPSEPETKPFDQEKSNSYGQNSVTQPYHSPAQIAAAAQGNLLPSYHMSNQHNIGYHQGTSNGIYHPNHNLSHHGHQNGFQGHGHNQPHYGRGFQSMQSGNFGPNRGTMNGNRVGHNAHHAPLYQGYSSFQAHPSNRGNGVNHPNSIPHYNNQYAPPGGMNVPLNSSNGYSRRFMHNPSTPTGDVLQSPGSGPTSYPIPRTGPMTSQSPLDNLNSLELPDIPAPTSGSNGGYRPLQEGHTPVGNGGHFSPPAQSYFPPQPSNAHNGFASGQGYTGGPPGTRYQS